MISLLQENKVPIADSTVATTMSLSGMDDRPDAIMVIEEMKESYKNAIGRRKLECPMNAKRQSHIGKIHIIEFGKEGVYIGRNFGENPHYMVDIKFLNDKIVPLCKRWGIPIKRYPKTNMISSSSILCVWQGIRSPSTGGHRQVSQLSRQTVCDEFDNLDFEELYMESNVIDQQSSHYEKDNPSRGARQMHFGYTSNHSLSRVVDEYGNISIRPSLIGGGVPTKWEKRFVSMTKIGDAMFDDDESYVIRETNDKVGLYGDSFRNDRFAGK